MTRLFAHIRCGVGAREGFPYVAPALMLVLLLTAIPVIRIAAISFEDGLENYRELFRSTVFWTTLRITLEVSLLVTLICLILGYPVSYLLSGLRRSRANPILLGVVATFWISVIVRAYAWMVLLGRRGLINETLSAMGIIEEPLDLLFSRPAVIIGMVHYLLPYMILTLYGGMVGIDRELLTAAATLGASGRQSFVRVFLPLSRPAVFAGSMLVFILALGFFVIPSLLGGSQEMMLAVYIERQTYHLNWGLASAAAMLLMIIAMSAFLSVDRLMGLDRLFASVRR